MNEPVEHLTVGHEAAPLSAQPSGGATCVWCGRPFAPRRTGGSAQRFCSAGHRNAFWAAGRRWTMRALEAGLISVEVLKAL